MTNSLRDEIRKKFDALVSIGFSKEDAGNEVAMEYTATAVRSALINRKTHE